MTDMGVGWRKAMSVQTKTWHQSMKILTVELNYVGRYMPPNLGSCHQHNQWLDALSDMTENHLQWHRYTHSLSSLNPKFVNWL